MLFQTRFLLTQTQISKQKVVVMSAVNECVHLLLRLLLTSTLASDALITYLLFARICRFCVSSAIAPKLVPGTKELQVVCGTWCDAFPSLSLLSVELSLYVSDALTVMVVYSIPTAWQHVHQCSAGDSVRHVRVRPCPLLTINQTNASRRGTHACICGFVWPEPERT